MNNLVSQDQEVNLVEIENQAWIDKYHALVRLYDNPDFQKVVLEGYFQERAVNGVSMLANQGVIRSNMRGEIIEELVGISRLQDYFITVRNLGRPAEDEEVAE